MSKLKWALLALFLPPVLLTGCQSIINVRVVTKKDTPTLPMTVMTPATVAVETASNPTSTNLLVWYDFEEDFLTSGRITDRSGNGHNARVVGNVNVTQGIFGGQAISFSGDGYIQAQNNPVAGQRQVTFSIWFKTDHPEANFKLASAAWWNVGPGSGWVLATHIPEFWSEDTHSLYLPDLTNVDNHFSIGEWVHEVVTYDGERIKEYTNGQIVNDWPTTGAEIGTGEPMAVGSWPQFSGYNFGGAIDEFQIFDRALTMQEVQAIYNPRQPFATSAIAADTGQWSPAGSMTRARAVHTATLLRDGRILLAGGHSGSTSAEIYDPTTNTFSPTGSLKTGRHDHSDALLPDGRVLVVGGYNNGYLSSAEIYDPATGQWTPSQPLFNHGVHNALTVLRDGRVLVTGGDPGGRPSTSVEIFDPTTDTWHEAAPLSIGRNCHAAILLNDGRVLVVGGNGDVEVLVAEIYDPATDTWTPTGPMNAKSGWLIAALLPDGRVLAAGGVNPASGEMYTTTEIYDPATGGWNLTAPLVPARCCHAAVVLPDGRVLVTGGAQRCGPEVSPFNIVEAYDYQSRTWHALPPLNIARVTHTATLLPDGRVFVAGGYDGNTYAASTEILELDGR